MLWKGLLAKLNLSRGTDVSSDVDVHAIEAATALEALDEVGCVEVSPEVAQELGAFEEKAITLDDVVDGA